MQNTRYESYIIIAIFAIIISACGGQRQPRAYGGMEMTADDSATIRMGQWDLIKYHSDKLGIDINYPSFLYHQDLKNETSQEVFMSDEMSLSVIVDSLQGNRIASQQMLAMGADLVEVGDDYSIQAGSDEDFDYYGKVIEDDTIRLVTVLAR